MRFSPTKVKTATFIGCYSISSNNQVFFPLSGSWSNEENQQKQSDPSGTECIAQWRQPKGPVLQSKPGSCQYPLQQQLAATFALGPLPGLFRAIQAAVASWAQLLRGGASSDNGGRA